MLKGIVLTKDAAFWWRGAPGAVGPAKPHRGASLLAVPGRAEVDHDKVFLFSPTDKDSCCWKRTDARGGGVGMRTSAEILQAERSIHGHHNIYTYINKQESMAKQEFTEILSLVVIIIIKC